MPDRVHEHRLGGRHTDAADIRRLVDRQLRRWPLRRVEVRLSSQAHRRPAAGAVAQALSRLLREHGQGQAEVSVRPIDLPIDDALGEHIVRLISTEPEVPPSTERMPVRWPWWRRLLAREPRAEPADDTAAPHAPPAAAIERRAAVELLRQALRLALAAPGAGRAGSGEAVQRAEVVVRDPALHRALAPLIADDPRAAATWMSRELASQHVTAAVGLRVGYLFSPPPANAGTVVAGGADVEVRFRRTATPAAGATAQPVPDAIDVTLQPAPGPDPDEHVGGLTVRWLGTDAERFAQPFESHGLCLPVRLDRELLRRAAGGRADAALLRVASQRHPLLVEPAATGGLTLHAPQRSGAASGGTSYHLFTPASQRPRPIVGRLDVAALPVQLLVNGPGPVHDPATGAVLRPLLLDLAWSPRSDGGHQPGGAQGVPG